MQLIKECNSWENKKSDTVYNRRRLQVEEREKGERELPRRLDGTDTKAVRQ